MPTTVELIKHELIEQLEHLAEKRLDPSAAPRAAEFVRGFYQHVPPGDLVRERPDALFAAAVSFLAFAAQREPGEPKVRVFSPTVDEHGWHTPHTVVEIVVDDMPFLVDSVTAELGRQALDLALVIHPVLSVKRSADGTLQQFSSSAAGDEFMQESFMQVRVHAQGSSRHEEVTRRLLEVLTDVRAAVADFTPMRARCAEIIENVRAANTSGDSDVSEICEFLHWLNEAHFTYVGYRYCRFEPASNELGPQLKREAELKGEAGLGILRDPERSVFEQLEPAGSGELLRILKTNQRSTVHRPVHLDAIVITEGAMTAGSGKALLDNPAPSHLFVGLFTLEAYAKSTERIPLLRRKVALALERSGLSAVSHDGKALRYILETYPRDELFQISDDLLLSIAMGILHLQNRQRVALFARRDPLGRFMSCLVYVPKDRMDTSLRLKIQEILAEAFAGTVAAYYTRIGDDPLARIHLIIKTPLDRDPPHDYLSIERRLYDATRSWQDRMESALINELGEERGLLQAREYAGVFPVAYRESFDELTAVTDIEFINEACETGEMTLHPYRKPGAPGYEFNLKVFIPNGLVPLSNVLPMLENMGLCVISEVPYELNLRRSQRSVDLQRQADSQRSADSQGSIRIHDFAVVSEGQVPVDLAVVRESFVEVFSLVWRGVVGNDGFNKLVLHAGLEARKVTLLRAYAKYLRQTQLPFSIEYMQQTLKRHPVLTRTLAELFSVKFDPTRFSSMELAKGASPQSRDERVKELVNTLRHGLEAVVSLDEDRILRSFLHAIEATLRTNFYQPGADGAFKDYVAFKIDSKRIEELPLPKPFREIFVFSSRVEGIHLRFGAVARGGLRWSDRPEDFRTEVLGLVKAQQVKNAVIVPVGSKGGFIVKRPPPTSEGREAALAEGVACYQTFISALLDVTDNRVGDEIVPPANVVVHDEPDPYLVVAADKGTATFSDIANAVSERYQFWLADAFASGGSAGYDHKQMGITARGAWESVKRHFRELGKDVQREPFTCVGVGDMSGDVFGNGLLLSKQTLLLAAFNHLHVFIDPRPDPDKSWAERKRLFELPRSTWADYDRSLISEGGGVFERSAKSIPLSEQMKNLLQIQRDSVTPTQLITALLKCEVELLFFGGIGTYVKARTESHAEVGDRANDGLRVNALELKASVIGEGANLGMTQRARVEFALKGGRCHTDFIDNSAGVDCSDHEVNIKILLNELVRAGDMTRKQRDALLLEMTDEVAALVLRDNYLQTQALSVTEELGTRLTDRLSRFVHALEKAEKLDRVLDGLPDEEALAERMKSGVAFTRPELSVLLSSSKNALYENLLSSDLPDQPYLEIELVNYFPRVLRERFADAIKSHRLRREIVATVISNDLVNRGGINFVYEASEKTGFAPGDVAKAYVVAREAFGLPALWAGIEALDNRVPALVQSKMLIECGRCLSSFSVWLLRTHGSKLDVAQLIETYGSGVRALVGKLKDLLSETDLKGYHHRVEALVEKQVPEELANNVEMLRLLAPLGDMVQVAHQRSCAPDSIAQLYFAVGDQFGLSWLRGVAAELPVQRAWDKQAITAIIDDLFATQCALVAAIAESQIDAGKPMERIKAWAESRAPQVNRNAQLITELQATGSIDFAMLAVANRQLKALLTA